MFRTTYLGRPANRFDMDALPPVAVRRGGIRLTSPLIERALLAYGFDTLRFDHQAVVADHPDLDRPLCFTPSKSAWTARPAHRVSVDKELTRQTLRDAGVPVPDGSAFDADQVEEAVAYAASLRTPVVVKPKDGLHGAGVSTDLRSTADVRRAIAALTDTRFGGRPFIVETYIPGDDYRLLVIGDRVVSVVLKRPAAVSGDGRSTVAALVEEKNRWRMDNPHTRTCPITLGPDAMAWLRRQALTPDSVPEARREVRLGSAGNIAAGGDSIEVLDETHPSLLELAVRAVHAIPGLDHAGIDVMGDHRTGSEEHPAAVIEVNGNPATSFHHFPLAGTPRDVSADLVLRSCELAGLDPGGRRTHLAVRIQVDGRVQGVGYRDWFAALARRRGVAGSVRNAADGGVEAVVVGPTDDVWVLAAGAIHGPRRATVTRVTTTHVGDVAPAGGAFEVVT